MLIRDRVNLDWGRSKTGFYYVPNQDSPCPFYNFFTNSARIALSTAMIITPTSAKIASHILAIPTAPSMRQISLMPMANQMF